jgi:hypothetical protein
MALPELSLRRLARGSAVVAGLVGTYHFLSLMGAFGPVSCWQGYSAGGTATSDGTVTTTTPTVTRGCESGVDFLLGGGAPGGGNAGVLFAWAVVLLALVAVGGVGVWTGRRRVAWGGVVVGAAVSVVGVFSIGWYFLLPTLFLAVGATALSVETRRS